MYIIDYFIIPANNFLGKIISVNVCFNPGASYWSAGQIFNEILHIFTIPNVRGL